MSKPDPYFLHYIVYTVFGILIALISYFLRTTINRFNKKIDGLEKKNEAHRLMIDANKATIKANKDMDVINQKHFKNILDRIEVMFKETIAELKNEIAELKKIRGSKVET